MIFSSPLVSHISSALSDANPYAQFIILARAEDVVMKLNVDPHTPVLLLGKSKPMCRHEQG